MSTLAASPRRRGTELLLAHTCTPVEKRPPAVVRLRAELGGDLADRLVATLARDQRDERRGRTSSSP